MRKLLLVEDDFAIVNTLSYILEQEGYEVKTCDSQKSAEEMIDAYEFDILILDVTLKEGNGFGVCKYAKQKGDYPVIFLTASDEEENVVKGLELGADDYISKPFRPLEFLSRIKSVLRRAGKVGSIIEYKNISIDTAKGIAYMDGKELFLSVLEYRLLLMLISSKGEILSRNSLLERLWDSGGEYVNDNTLTVYIKRLREKIEIDPQNPKIILTVRGLGYKVGD